MTVQSVQYQNTLNFMNFNRTNKAMVTSWIVKQRDQTKTYYVVILQDPKLFGFRSSTSAYVTDQKPAQEDVSKSQVHTHDMSKKILRDYSGNAICAYDPALEANLGFTVAAKEFKKVDLISQELITNLGAFLKDHLNKSSTSAPESPAAASSSSASGSMAPTSPSSSSGGTPEPGASSNASKSRLKSLVSALSKRVTNLGPSFASKVTCDRVGFLASTIAIAAFWVYLNVDNEIPTTLISL